MRKRESATVRISTRLRAPVTKKEECKSCGGALGNLNEGLRGGETIKAAVILAALFHRIPAPF
jgi:hypothetical protein